MASTTKASSPPSPPPRTPDDEEFLDDKREKKRLRLEAAVTAGCGYGRSKQRILKAFYEKLWPKLVEGGWTKVEASGKNVGATYFVPPGVDVRTAKRREYYDKVKSVIERVLEHRNGLEASAAELYSAEMGTLESAAADDDGADGGGGGSGGGVLGLGVGETDAEGKRNGPKLTARQAQVSWRHFVDGHNWKTHGRTSFPKMSSRTGPNYQVGELPVPTAAAMAASSSAADATDGSGSGAAAVADGESSDSSLLYEQVWDPQKAEAANKTDFVHMTVPHNKKEAGMVALHRRNYALPGLYDELSTVSPLDGSDWTQAEKDKFHGLIFETRKNLSTVARKMNKSLNNCLAYYLGSYKRSDDYRVLKVVCAQERDDAVDGLSSNFVIDACEICGDGGSLIVCDECEEQFHLTCLRPPLERVPEGRWECDKCVDVKFLKARAEVLSGAGILGGGDRSDAGSMSEAGATGSVGRDDGEGNVASTSDDEREGAARIHDEKATMDVQEESSVVLSRRNESDPPAEVGDGKEEPNYIISPQIRDATLEFADTIREAFACRA